MSDKIVENELYKEIYNEGYIAFELRFDSTENPYKYFTIEHKTAWSNGWLAAKVDNGINTGKLKNGQN